MDEKTAAQVDAQGSTTQTANVQMPTKFCKSCGRKVHINAVICPHCGCQIEEIANTAPTPTVIVNNTNQNVNTNVNKNMVGGYRKICNKWVAFLLCLFLGYLGAHKFYEGKIGRGILYLVTAGLFGIGWFVDCIILLLKPNPYYV